MLISLGKDEILSLRARLNKDTRITFSRLSWCIAMPFRTVIVFRKETVWMYLVRVFSASDDDRMIHKRSCNMGRGFSLHQAARNLKKAPFVSSKYSFIYYLNVFKSSQTQNSFKKRKPGDWKTLSIWSGTIHWNAEWSFNNLRMAIPETTGGTCFTQICSGIDSWNTSKFVGMCQRQVLLNSQISVGTTNSGFKFYSRRTNLHSYTQYIWFRGSVVV